MEHISKEDLNAIHSIIEEFEGDTVLGKHMFKAIKAYFKQKSRVTMVTYAKEEKKLKSFSSKLITKDKVSDILKGADEVLHRNFLKLRKKGKLNGNATSKKKANK